MAIAARVVAVPALPTRVAPDAGLLCDKVISRRSSSNSLPIYRIELDDSFSV